MIYSMTGYGKASICDERWTLQCEMTSVNNRYLDVRLKLPSLLNFAQMPLRTVLQRRLGRGRVEVTISCRFAEGMMETVIRRESLIALVKEVQSVQTAMGIDQALPIGQLLQIPGIVEQTPLHFDERVLLQSLEELLENAVKDLLRMRQEEGERLADDLRQKLKDIERQRLIIAERAPVFASEQREKFQQHVRDILADHLVDETRLMTEIAIMAQKVDIDEEIVRLQSHLVAFENTLDQGGAVGKKLDFLIQEMNREINTMSSKSNDEQLTGACVQSKVLVEKLREQIQNLE